MEYVYYVGHSTFEILISGKRILIDPFFGNTIRNMPRQIPASEKPGSITKADMILITHEHPDHFEKDTVQEIVKRTGASVIAPKNVLSQLKIDEKSKVDIRVGDSFGLEGINIEVVKALHPQSEYPVGYIMEASGRRIYHAGDTYEHREMIGMHVDWALIPIGGSFTMDPISAIKACKEINPSYVVPMHYNTYDTIKQSVVEFASEVETTGKTKPVVMKAGQSIQI